MAPVFVDSLRTFGIIMGENETGIEIGTAILVM